MLSSTADRSADPVVTVDGLHKRYGSTVAVHDVGFDVRRGEIFGILGPNGAGKTTTVECLTGLRAPDRGTVRVLGLDPQRDGLVLRQRVGCQLQESELPGKLRAGEALDVYSSFYEDPADGRALADRLGLGGSLDTPYAKLSGGQKQRLSIALALIGNPEIAVLDELTTGLDPQARRDTWELVEGVREQGVTIVLVTHFMDEAERLCDRLALIDHGRVVATDTPSGLVRRAGVDQVLRFRTADPVPDERLRAALAQVPAVEEVDLTGDDVVVRGGHDVVVAALLGLTRQGITPVAVAAERGRLEDAFVELTRRDRDDRPGSDTEPGTILEEV